MPMGARGVARRESPGAVPRDELVCGDALEVLRTLPDACVQTCVTSPPYYGLRDYGVAHQIGLEATPDLYVAHLVEAFGEVRRVLCADGTLWLNLGDSYSGGGPHHGDRNTGKSGTNRGSRTGRNDLVLSGKNLLMMPARVALALQADGWWVRAEIIWHKPNVMPESVRDRPTRAHETVYLLAKSARYYYDADAIREPLAADCLPRVLRGRSDHHKYADGGPGHQTLMYDISKACNPSGRNRRDVWTICPQPFRGAHFAVMAPALVEPCILAGSRPGDLVLDPFSGAATVPLVARRLGRSYLGIELNPAYVALGQERLAQDTMPKPSRAKRTARKPVRVTEPRPLRPPRQVALFADLQDAASA